VFIFIVFCLTTNIKLSLKKKVGFATFNLFLMIEHQAKISKATF